ncbi:hypothetical protein Tco_1457777 [Tanacetum coccineum]
MSTVGNGEWNIKLENIDNEVLKVIQLGTQRSGHQCKVMCIQCFFLPTTPEEQFADEKDRKARTLLHLENVAFQSQAKASSSKHNQATEYSYNALQAKYDELQSEFGNQEAALVAHKKLASTVKIGLGYGIKSNAEVLGYEEEISRGIFAFRETDAGNYDIPLYSRFNRPQPQSPSPSESDASSTDYINSVQSNDSDGEQGTISDHSVNDVPIPIPSIEQFSAGTAISPGATSRFNTASNMDNICPKKCLFSKQRSLVNKTLFKEHNTQRQIINVVKKGKWAQLLRPQQVVLATSNTTLPIPIVDQTPDSNFNVSRGPTRQPKPVEGLGPKEKLSLLISRIIH